MSFGVLPMTNHNVVLLEGAGQIQVAEFSDAVTDVFQQYEVKLFCKESVVKLQNGNIALSHVLHRDEYLVRNQIVHAYVFENSHFSLRDFPFSSHRFPSRRPTIDAALPNHQRMISNLNHGS